MSKPLKVALAQQSCGADRKSNLATSEAMVREAARNDAKLIVLQELLGLPYFCQEENPAHFDLAEPVPGPTTDILCTWAKETETVLAASVFERRGSGVHHNTGVIADRDGSLAGVYRKMHIPDDPAYYEKFYFTPGDTGFKPIETSIGTLGLLVCWDQWFPEAARLMALQGADVLIYPSAIGWDPADSEIERARQREAWMLSHRGHAVSNCLPVLAVNRVGSERNTADGKTESIFWGSSFVAGPQGEIVEQASDKHEGILYAALDLERTDELRRIWPFFRDRRIDAYGGLQIRYGGTNEAE